MRPVLHHLAGGALVEGEDGRAAGQRLEHHDPERLVPADGEEQGTGAGQQVPLLLLGHLADEPEPVVEVGGDVALEVPPLGRLPDLPGQDQPLPGLEGRLERPVRALLRRHLAEEQEVAAIAPPDGEGAGVDAVVDDPGHRHARDDLGLGGGDDDGRARHAAVEAGALAVERAVGGGHHRPGSDERPGDRVVVDEVAVGQRLVGGQHMDAAR